MKYVIIVLMLAVSACSKDFEDDNLKVSFKKPIEKQADTIVIPIQPRPNNHELVLAGKG